MSTYEPAGDDEEDLVGNRPSGDWTIEGTATVWSAAILAADPGHLGIALATTLPFAAKLAHALDVRAWQQRVLRGGQALEAAAAELAIDLEGLAHEAARSDPRTELLGRVIAAAASTVNLTAKIKALGVVLANGLRDDSKVDQAVDLVALLAIMEPPHLRALGVLYDRWENNSDDRDGWTTTEHIAAATGQSVRNSAVMEALTSHAACHQRPAALMNNDGYLPVAYSLSWRVTDLGLDCLLLLGNKSVIGRPPGSRLPQDDFLK